MAPDDDGYLGACYGRECVTFENVPGIYYTVRKPG